jgi:hypothetical protein
VENKTKEIITAGNKGLASGGLTFNRESSCGLSRPNAKPLGRYGQCNDSAVIKKILIYLMKNE